jgi:hypothetical protein
MLDMSLTWRFQLHEIKARRPESIMSVSCNLRVAVVVMTTLVGASVPGAKAETAASIDYSAIDLVHDAGDAIVQAFEPYMLLGAATSPGSLVPSAKLVVLPNPKPPSPAAHYFVDNQQPLVDTVTAWLAEQKL